MAHIFVQWWFQQFLQVQDLLGFNNYLESKTLNNHKNTYGDDDVNDDAWGEYNKEHDEDDGDEKDDNDDVDGSLSFRFHSPECRANNWFRLIDFSLPAFPQDSRQNMCVEPCSFLYSG